MYYVKFGKEYLHDPREGLLLDSAEAELEVNASGSFSFTIYSTHPLFDTISERDTANPVTIYHDDELIFYGDITEIESDFYLGKKCVCRGALGWLNDTLIRPYSTLEGECDNVAPSSVDGYFEWLIEQHNRQVEQTKTFKIGKNEGSLLDKNNYLYRSDSTYPSTGSLIAEKIIGSLGGYLQFRYEDGIRYIDLLTDFPTVNAQVIDFGVNLLDYANTDVTDDMATFVVPIGSTIEKEEGSSDKEVEQHVTISSLDNGGIAEGYFKSGDIIYSERAVEKYGWIGAVVEFKDITEPKNLQESGLIALKEVCSPVQTVELTAVDLAMIDPKHKPIYIGQYIRARSKPHNFDSFMLCSALKLNLNNPDSNKITLGHTFSKLTGVQNKRINALNATINTVYESASQISAEAKAASIAAAQGEAKEAQSTANDAKETAESIALLVISTDKSTTFRSPDETAMATANVFHKGVKLTEEEVAELGTVRWYLNGTNVAEGMTYSLRACNGTLKARLEV